MSIAAVFAGVLVLFLIIWMSLSFTNQLCDSVGLCYNKVCPVCPSTPAPAPAPAPATATGYMPEPYVKE